MLLLNSSLILLVAASAANAGLSYDGHKVVRAKVEDEAQASALHQLSEIGIYDFWTEVSKIIKGCFNLIECYISRQSQDGLWTSGLRQSRPSSWESGWSSTASPGAS